MTKSNMNTPGYETLAAVLQRAYEQAANGKGKERHAGEGVPFEKQPMALINMTLGSVDGYLFQAAKKAQEARRLPAGRAQAELLGAINYLAGAVIALDTWAAGTLPVPVPAAGDGDWIPWDVTAWGDGVTCPVAINAMIQVKTRSGQVIGPYKACIFVWKRHSITDDIVAFRFDQEPSTPQHEPAAPATNEEWIPWDGGDGKNPLSNESIVLVKLRNQSRCYKHAVDVRWSWYQDGIDSNNDVIAYRVVNDL